jgi:hypothetical protein
MKDFLVVTLGLFLIWFVLGVMRKRFYYGEVEAVMKSRGYLPKSLSLLMGSREYFQALEECRKRGMKSHEAAYSLIGYFDQKTEGISKSLDEIL